MTDEEKALYNDVFTEIKTELLDIIRSKATGEVKTRSMWGRWLDMAVSLRVEERTHVSLNRDINVMYALGVLAGVINECRRNTESNSYYANLVNGCRTVEMICGKDDLIVRLAVEVMHSLEREEDKNIIIQDEKNF